MDQIRERIHQTVSNLSEKKKILERHKQQYIDLKFTLYDYEQYSEHDTPEIEVSITSKAKVKAHVLNPKKILVFLGCEYFVERDPATAVVQVENKLKYLNNTINDFTTKIKEAKKTLENIASLEKMEAQKKELEEDGSKYDDGIPRNEEGLQFMDIREELDEEGNVLNTVIHPQNENRLKDFGAKHGFDLIGGGNDLSDLLKDMEITSNPTKIEEIKEPSIEAKQPTSVVEDDIIGNEDQTFQNIAKYNDEAGLGKVVERDEPAVLDQIIERDDPVFEIVERQPAVLDVAQPETFIENDNSSESTESVKDDVINDPHEYSKLLEEFGITNLHIKPIASKSISGSNEIEHDVQSPLPKLTAEELAEKYPSSKPALDEEDLLQLQLISDELGEDTDGELDEDNYYYDEDDFQASLNNDEDDNDNEYKDWDEYSEDGEDEDNEQERIIPSDYRNLFMEELNRVRKGKDVDNQEKGEIQGVKMSPTSSLKKTESKEKKSVKFAEKLQIKEVENISEQLKEVEVPSKVSKFKQNRMNGNFGIKFTSGFNNFGHIQDKEDTVGDVVDREETIQEAAEEDDEEDDERAVHDIVERVEAEPPVVETRKRLSKFKTSLNQTPISKNTSASLKQPVSTVIQIPVNETMQPTSADEYQNIKEYIEDDDEDEQLLNAITDNISVYRGDDDEEGDTDYEDEDDGVMLADQIVDNDEVDEPGYFVDNGLLEQEYRIAKRSMIEKYLTEEEKREMGERNKVTIAKDFDEGQELEPIDESGNPVKVSRFRKALGK